MADVGLDKGGGFALTDASGNTHRVQPIVPMDTSGARTTLVTSDVSTTAAAAGIGATDDAVADAGGTGSLSAKLRRVTDALGAAADAVAVQGAAGSISAKLRLATSQLNSLISGITALINTFVAGNNIGSVATVRTSLTAAHSKVNVGTSTTVVLASAGTRKGCVITNVGANRVTLNFGGDAVLDTGLTLMPGATFTMGEYDFSTAAINGIAATAATDVSVVQFT